MSNLGPAAGAVRRAITSACSGLVDRRALVELVALSAVAGEHVLVLGPPGTAKSEAVRRIARNLGGKYFEYLLGRFTEPSEIFGPVSLRRLKDGVLETETQGMLPEAEIAFLDEVFLGSTAILNTLLGVLNERRFRRGHTAIECPLRVCVGAANRLPEDEHLAAFADRFLVRVFVGPVGDARLEELLEASWTLGGAAAASEASMADVDTVAKAARAADVAGVRPALAHALRLVRAAGVELTDRRAARVQRLVAAAAALAGRGRADERDLWPIVFAVPTESGQRIARDALRDVLAASENESLPAAAEEGSLGPRARAARLVEHARALFEAPPAGADRGPFRQKLEGIAREIDAGFAPAAMPPELAEVRARIVAELGAP
ncbi:AAA family ATPase [Polyangium aurulentum]|uniref:AAA family ATPase n=1 Tax=Polyangium aurulentum TaxID=2567896 RepID=UPI0010ADC3D8|nr:AAA family ATPase [Polyangium aurulentum]UQA57503.1 AAA family ATPase [Polyangium aurulentum]